MSMFDNNAVNTFATYWLVQLLIIESDLVNGSIVIQWTYIFVKRKSGFPPKLTRDLGRMLRTVPGTSSSGLICLHTGNTGICPSARPIGYVLSWPGLQSIFCCPPSTWPHRSSSQLENNIVEHCPNDQALIAWLWSTKNKNLKQVNKIIELAV